MSEQPRESKRTMSDTDKNKTLIKKLSTPSESTIVGMDTVSPVVILLTKAR
jgi:hypothetical protein